VKVQKTILIRPPKTPLIHLNQTRKLVGQLWEIKVITLFWPCATHTETSKASWWPPSISKAHAALEDLCLLLKPRKCGSQSTASQKLPLTLTERLNHMSRFLWAYTDVGHDGEPHSFNPVGGQWSKAADQTARTINFGEQKSSYLSWKLRKWTRAYISNWSTLPFQQKWQRSSAIDNEAVVEELSLHLCSIGKYAHAKDILDFLRDPKNQECLKVPGSISLKTAHHWMKRMGWQWKWEAKGQYVDGHKHEDVVTYRQNIFLPAWSNLQPQMRKWQVNPTNNDVKEIMEAQTVPWCHAVVWFHGESTLDANNQRKLRWVHQTENAVPQPKGEGVSLMVSDFVSADYGWLWSPNGNESAHVLFKAGKGSDGYFTNDEVVAQVGNAMDILVKHYLNEEHIFMFDNAKTHLKCASDVLSACKMPKSPSESWGIMVIAKDANGKPVHDGNGNVVKEKIQVTDAQLPKGTPPATFTFRRATSVLDGLREWLRFLSNEATQTHLVSQLDVRVSSVHRIRQSVAVIDWCLINPISRMSSQLLRQPVSPVDQKSFSCQSFIASSILLSSVGGLQSGFIEWSHAQLLRMHWKGALSTHSKLCPWTQCGSKQFLIINHDNHMAHMLRSDPALQSDCHALWMHISRGSMGSKPLGQSRSTVVTMYSQKVFCLNLILPTAPVTPLRPTSLLLEQLNSSLL